MHRTLGKRIIARQSESGTETSSIAIGLSQKSIARFRASSDYAASRGFVRRGGRITISP